MLARSAALAAALLMCCTVPALADWPVEGQDVLCALQSSSGIGYVRIVEMPSGDLMVVAQGKGGSGCGWKISRVERDGTLAPGWSASGLPLGTTQCLTKLVGFAPDDSSGFWLVWPSFGASPSGYHALPDGTLETTTGYSLTLWADAATVAGSSDIYLSSGGSNRVRRVTRVGKTAAGWPIQVLPEVPNSYPAILPDGAGGVVFVGQSLSQEWAARLDANGALHAGWAAGGLRLGPSNVESSQGIPGYEFPLQSLVPSGPDHMIAIWPEYAEGSTQDQRVLLQRFGLDGTRDPAWPADGLQAVASDSIHNVTMVADGEGGVYVLWERSQRPRGTHVRADGTFAGSLDDTGVPLLPAGAPYVPMESGGSKGPVTLVAVRGPDGGLAFVSSEPTGDANPSVLMRVRWYAPDLSPDPAAPDTGVVVDDGLPHAVSGGYGIQRAALVDGSGGLFLAWSGQACSAAYPYETSVRMTHVTYPATSGVPVAAGAALSLGGAMPNPVRGVLALRFTLPDDRPARLEVFDASGRRVRGVDVRGAGAHVQRFDDLDALAPGLYLARLTQGAVSRTTRFVRIP